MSVLVKISKSFATVFLALLCFFSFFGCSKNESTSEQQVKEYDPGIAAVEVDIEKKTELASKTLSDDSTFSVIFFDVGQGDSALVECDGHYMLIDGGDSKKSSLLYSYFKSHNITHLDYLIATHEDSDHTGGISGALQLASVDRAFCSVTEASQKSFNSMVSYLNKRGVGLEIPSRGDTWQLGSSSVEVIAPTGAVNSSNNSSIMLRITYGETSFVFAGDAEEDEEISCCYNNRHIKANVLKVAHHGSKHSSCARFLNAVSPEYAIISVGKDNTYGHPTDEALNRLISADATIYRTDLQGDIVATSNGKEVSIEVQKTVPRDLLNMSPSAVAAAEEAASGENASYIGNKNSKKFHKITCRSLPSEKNRITLSSREDALNQGYSPCGVCKP